ncbi:MULTISPECIES: HNH endonuclease [Halorubrum]|uniref:HNH endonuclease n=1 Tax=Halorubrum ruber TaxID=2982524 RepID=A0A8T8LHM5_9EURY|nr:MULTISPECIES: HNH endonuclease signature motif containing protein [Halorubrum]QUO46543.1 HNH endonuclease [Halorubrum ruber]
MPESYKILYQQLRETELACVPPGFQDTSDVYDLVETEYPELCDDSILCREVCSSNSTQPEWKHRLRTVQQSLLEEDGSRIKRLSKGWFYEPIETDVSDIPDDPTQFTIGSRYNRWELHDIYGGQRYYGIATPSDQDFILAFTGDSGDAYGYADGFQEDGSFKYTGEGQEGDMTMDKGNIALRDHQENGENLYLFADTEYPWIATYRGEYQYEDHHWETLPDKNNNLREAIRFTLTPVGGREITIDGDPDELSLPDLFEAAKRSAPKRSTDGTTSSGRTYVRSEIVKKFARRVADGVCMGCENPAPFEDIDGEPYLEVHHLHNRGDGGPDDPENVIAICPNCHRRVHYGRDGKSFNRGLINKAEELYGDIDAPTGG